MQKTLAELFFLPETELLRLVEQEPILITQNGEPKFVAQSLEAFESMVRSVRALQTERNRSSTVGARGTPQPRPAPSSGGKVVPFRP